MRSEPVARDMPLHECKPAARAVSPGYGVILLVDGHMKVDMVSC